MGAIDHLTSVLGLRPENLEQKHSLLKLLGIVLSQLTLLEILTNPESAPKDKIQASRLLLSTDESPEVIAERLRSSPFADLSLEELHQLTEYISKGVDLDTALRDIKSKRK